MPENRGWSRRFGAAVLVLFLAVGSGVVSAQDRRAEPGSAPLPGRGSIVVEGYVRVVDGSSIEVLLDGRRAAVGVVGIETPQANTRCGEEAATRLRDLVRDGVRLEEDSGPAFDERGRRMYRMLTGDGRLIAEELIAAGVARANGIGADQARLAAAEARALAAGSGCIRGTDGPLPSRPSQPAAVSSSDGPARTAAPASFRPPAPSVPPGFVHDVLASGFYSPSAMAVLPDGRILIGEKSGVVWVYKDGAVLSAPFANVMDRVNNYWDRGFVGIAPDRDFAENGYVYFLYTYENNPARLSGPKTARLTRVKAVGDRAAPHPGSPHETVVLGMSVGAGCGEFPSGADCIPSEWVGHTVGGVRAAPDGTIFVSTGDAANWNVVTDSALRTLDLDVLAGKVLRVSTEDCSSPSGSRGCGKGVPSNPFWNGNADANRSKVWATGARNIFRFAISPFSGTLFAGDVGWSSWEEINTVPAGANLGWPCYEGAGHQSGYEPKAACQALYAQGSAHAPLTSWDHSDGLSTAALAGPFYTATAFPSEYHGVFFYGDYGKGTISYLRTNGSDQAVSGPTIFATGLGAPTQVELGVDGSLYYIDFVSGELRRIRWSESTIPTVSATTPLNGATGVNPEASMTATFSTAMDSATITAATFTLVDQATSTPVVASVSYNANTRVATLTPASALQANTTYVAAIKGGSSGARSAEGAPLTEDAVWTFTTAPAANSAPTPTIASPNSGLLFKVGDTIVYSGSGVDAEDGTLADSQLSWRIIIHHCPGIDCHTHDLLTVTGSDGTFTAPDHGDGMYLELILTATDSAGLTGTTSVEIHPVTTQITLQSVPAGLQLVYGGETVTAPMTRTTIVGSSHTIHAPSPQAGKVWSSWSDNGAQQHDVTVGDTPVTFTATFVDSDATPPTISGTSPVADATGVTGTSDVTATFSEAMATASITSTTFTLVKQGTTGPVAATVTYDAASKTATLDPNASLEAGATYAATIKGGSSGVKDLAGNPLAHDVTWTFTVAPAADTTPPIITNIQVGSISGTSATVSWATSEPADSAVDYGTTPAYGASTPVVPALVTSHEQVITGLTPGTSYHFRVRSQDASGNLATSGNQVFVTLTVATPCNPRPTVAIATVPDGPGRLRVTATVGTSSLLPTNSIQRLRIVGPQNALIDIPNGQTGAEGNVEVALPAGTRQVTFFIRRNVHNQPTTVPFVIVDACGEWRSLAGGGASAF